MKACCVGCGNLENIFNLFTFESINRSVRQTVFGLFTVGNTMNIGKNITVNKRFPEFVGILSKKRMLFCNKMIKLSQIQAPALAGVVRTKTAREAMAEIKNCLYHGADMIDLHLSCLEDPCEENLKAIVDSLEGEIAVSKSSNLGGAFFKVSIPLN